MNGIFQKDSKSCELFCVPENELVGANALELEKRGGFDISATSEVIRKGLKVIE